MKARRVSLMVLACALICAVFGISGCGITDNNDNIKNYGKLIIKQESIPEDAAYCSYAVYSKNGQCVKGPFDVKATERYPFYAVPIYAKSLSIVYYAEDQQTINHIYTTQFEVTANQTLDVIVPPEEIYSVGQVKNLVDFSVGYDTRACVSDMVQLSALAMFKGAESFYVQDYSAYAGWKINAGSSLVATTDANGNELKRGCYRCVKAGTEPVSITASFSFLGCSDDTELEVTNATIKRIKLTTQTLDDNSSFETLPDAGTVICPDGATFVPLYCVAEWSDGVLSVANCLCSWVTGDSRIVSANAKNGLLAGLAVGEKNEDREREQSVVTIEATCTSNSVKTVKTCQAQVVDCDLTSLRVKFDPAVMVVGEECCPDVYGVYGALSGEHYEVPLPYAQYKVESSDAKVISCEDNLLTAVSAGTAKVTWTSLQSASCKCTVEVVVNDPS